MSMKAGDIIIAIYARQSADKIDSISIETQIELCKRHIFPDEEFQVFSDKGYSGANTSRPQFQKMLSLCREGIFSKIITYKLDRISRSLLDFVLLLEELENFCIELVSCTESFSSKSEMGVLIMKLLIMFAEMERKNIRMRVRDNYYARGEKGFYLGGYPPFGYDKTEILLDGKKTSGYKINEKESKTVKEIFSRFCTDMQSASEICRYLNSCQIKTRKGGFWSPTTLVRLLRNPFYVKADWKIYRLFLSEGAVITSPAQSFCGKYGCICYGEKQNREKGKFLSFKNEHITVGRHEGIISSRLWLEAKKRLDSSACFLPAGDMKTYLTGLAVCAVCGKKFTLTCSKGYTYMYCRGRKNASCDSPLKSLRADFLEKICEKIILSSLKNLSKRQRKTSQSKNENSLHLEIQQKKARLSQLKEQLKRSDEKSVEFFSQAAGELNTEIGELEKKLSEEVENHSGMCYTEITKICALWEKIPNRQRRIISGKIIDRLIISKGKIQIYLKTRSFYDYEK